MPVSPALPGETGDRVKRETRRRAMKTGNRKMEGDGKRWKATSFHELPICVFDDGGIR